MLAIGIKKHVIFFVLLLFIFGLPNAVVSQRLSLTGQIGYGHHSNNPFLNKDEGWHYNQLFLEFTLSGHIWRHRFMTFSLTTNYSDTNYSQDLENSNFNNFGYQLHTHFFSGRKINFGFRIGRSELNYNQVLAGADAANTHSSNKEFFLNILRIKFLPNIRIQYLDQDYFSEYNPAYNQGEKRLDIQAARTLGISHFDLDYRSRNRENDFLSIDTINQNLRITERLNFNEDTKLYINGIYNRYSVALPDNTSLGTDAGGLSTAFNRRFSDKLQTSIRYNLNLRSGEDFSSSSHNLGLRATYDLAPGLMIVPEVNYYTGKLDTLDFSDRVREPGLGVRASYRKDFAKIRTSTSLGFYYRNKQSDREGNLSDFSQNFSLSLSAGKIEKLMGTLSFVYDKLNLDSSQPEDLTGIFYEGLGRKQDYQQVRLELRSRFLRSVNIYFYSNYMKYNREYDLGRFSDIRNLDSGVTLSIKRLSLSGSYGTSRFYTGEEEVDYDSYSFLLDFNLIKGLDFRVKNMKRTRTDITFLGDYELVQEAYLKYKIGRFSLSAVYRRRTGLIQGIDRQDEGFSIRISRSLGVIF